MNNLGDKRENYSKGILTKENLALDPMIQFENWYHDAEEVESIEPNAMNLSTANLDGRPSSRMVLLKGFGPKGFIFYTNYRSRKAQDLFSNPQASLSFWWPILERQVRIEGEVVKASEETSRSYFNSRPRGSQISAWASPQSQEIKEHYLDDKRKEIEDQFKDEDKLPLPPHWGGFILRPSTIEFWQGRSSRYHDRYRYSASDDGHWKINRLAP